MVVKGSHGAVRRKQCRDISLCLKYFFCLSAMTEQISVNRKGKEKYTEKKRWKKNPLIK